MVSLIWIRTLVRHIALYASIGWRRPRDLLCHERPLRVFLAIYAKGNGTLSLEISWLSLSLIYWTSPFGRLPLL
jgi:hypothetical protein